MDPVTANLISAAVPAGLVALAVTVILLRRGRGRSSGALTGAESIVISLVGAGAMLNALGCILGLWGNASWMFSAEPFQVTGVHYAGATTPELLVGVDHIAASGYESVWMDVMGLPTPSRWLQLDLAPVGWAFGLALVAAAFQIGARLQREAELLV